MKSTVLVPGLLVGSGALATGIVFSQNISFDSMSNFIEYPEDARTSMQSVKNISQLITEIKNKFETLKEKIEIDEKAFADYKKILKDEEDIKRMKAPRTKELVRTKFLINNFESLIKSEGLLSSKKEKLQEQKTSLEKKIKEIESEGKEYGNKDEATKKFDMEEISKLAGDFSKKIQELYEELFLFFKPYRSLISKNPGINRRKSLSALLSTAEKVGLLEEKRENTNYISSDLYFTKTIDTSDEKLMSEIKKNNCFTVDEDNSIVVLKTINEGMWDFFNWNNSDSRKDLSDWNSWIKNR